MQLLTGVILIVQTALTWTIDVAEQCSSEDDCPAQMICTNGFCMPATPIPNICSLTRKCPFPARCRYRTCWIPLYVNCASNMDCRRNMVCRYGFCDIDPKFVTKSLISCGSHADCPGAEICSKSKCKPALSNGIACWSEADCAGTNAGCKFGFCWQMQDFEEEAKQSTSNPAASTTCLDHAECSQSAICFEQQCRNAKPSQQSCTDDTDCKPWGACKYAFCWSINSHGKLNENGKILRCTRHEECGLTKMCSSIQGHTCVPAYPVGKVCSTAFDCDASEECKESICWRKGKTGKEENEDCRYHSDCNGYTICLDHVCTPAVPTEIICMDDASCPDVASGCKYERCWITLDEQKAGPVRYLRRHPPMLLPSIPYR
uniref:EB domain-containing protein n=1 Tax=Trichuris muris TaxID=70415 RepID=A0A5S6R3B1_TRIMR